MVSISSLYSVDPSEIIFLHHLFFRFLIMSISHLLGIAPFVPDMAITVLKSFFGINPFDKSFQLYCKNSHRDFLGRQQREAIRHIVSDRPASNRVGADSGSICFFWSFENFLNKIKVLSIDMGHEGFLLCKSGSGYSFPQLFQYFKF